MNADMHFVLKEILARAGSTRVLVVGDLILDEYLWGHIERISPEAPVPIVELDNRRQRFSLGGAANVAHNLKHLGANVFLAGIIGDDPRGMSFCQAQIRDGIDAMGTLIEKGRVTTCKTRVIAQDRQVIRIDQEVKCSPNLKSQERLWCYIEGVIPQVAGVILSDYGKGVLNDSLLRLILDQAKSLGIPILVDPYGVSYERYNGSIALTPNLKEAELLIGEPLGDWTLIPAGDLLLKNTGCKYFLITRGKEGMSLFQQDAPPRHIRTQAQEVFDVSGAGDTVISVFGLGIILGCDPLACAKLANLAAGIVVSKIGTTPITTQELEDRFYGKEKIELNKPIIRPPEVEKILCWAYAQGKQVVFAQGTYDPIFPKDVAYLQDLRNKGDMLIVFLEPGLNPLIPQQERAFMLSAFSCVDYVAMLES